MKLELKIKFENKKEVVLEEKEAKELFEKLHETFGYKKIMKCIPWESYFYWWKPTTGNAEKIYSGRVFE